MCELCWEDQARSFVLECIAGKPVLSSAIQSLWVLQRDAWRESAVVEVRKAIADLERAGCLEKDPAGEDVIL